MLSFPTQNDKKKCPTDRVYSKKQSRMTANQPIFKSGLIIIFFSQGHKLLVFQPLGHVENNHRLSKGPSEQTLWILTEQALFATIATI